MNPFTIIYAILIAATVVHHLLGNLQAELLGLASMLLFLRDFFAWRSIKEVEPDWLEGMITKVIAKYSKPAAIIAIMLGSISVV